MTRTYFLVVFVTVVMTLQAYADTATAAYKRGEKLEVQNKLDAAYEAYKEAYDLRPRNAKYLAAYTRVRFSAGAQHVHAGIALRDGGKLQDALSEFQRAVAIDHSSFIAQEESRRTVAMIRRQEQHLLPELVSPLAKLAEEAEGPIELRPLSTTPISLRLSADADEVYKIISKLAGVNVLLDPDWKPPHISVELNNVTAREALDMVALQSKTFWQPASPNTILVASDTPAKRKDLQGNVMKTFYLRNVSTPNELSDAANILKGILDLSRVQLNPTQNAIILRGTSDQMVLAEKLLSDIDKPKAEVVIDIAVMQVTRDRLRTLGTSPPTSASVVLSPAGTTGSSSNSQLTLNSFRSLTANNFLVSIPGASMSALMSDSNTKLIQNPEIRAMDNEKATLKIGDRVPIATGSYQPGLGGGGINPLVNTQFQYLDVGVNIDITPHVHSDHEVTLKMVLEISSVTGTQNIGGISQPVIGQRRIEHETRLQDGDVNLVGGILEDSETQSLSGYPWLAKVPILKYLFGQEDKDVRENEIIFAITPHIVRAQQLTEENLRLVDVGTGSSTGIRHKDKEIVKADNAVPPVQGGPAKPEHPCPVNPPQPSTEPCVQRQP
jgi:general secretion pathway protein D